MTFFFLVASKRDNNIYTFPKARLTIESVYANLKGNVYGDATVADGRLYV